MPSDLRSRKSWCFALSVKAGESQCRSLKTDRHEEFLLGGGLAYAFYSGLQLTGPTLGSCSVVQSCLTLCAPMDCNKPGFPVLHCLLEFAQTPIREGNWLNAGYWFKCSSQPKTHRNTQSNVWVLCGPVKLTQNESSQNPFGSHMPFFNVVLCPVVGEGATVNLEQPRNSGPRSHLCPVGWLLSRRQKFALSRRGSISLRLQTYLLTKCEAGRSCERVNS